MKTWLKGLLAAIIGGTANAITTVVVAPDTFNFTTGLDKLLSVAGASALISAALYLKKSPLPEDSVADSGVSKIPLILVFLLSVSAMGGCSSVTPAQQKLLAQFEQAAVQVAPLVRSYADTGRVDYAQAIPVALNSLAIFAPDSAVDTGQLSSRIVDAVGTFTDGSGDPIGQKIAAIVLKMLPQNPTGAQANAVLTQAGIGASTGAN